MGAQDNYQQGNIARKQGDLQQAAKHYQAQIKSQPGHIAAVINLAITYNDLGQKEKALAQVAAIDLTQALPDAYIVKIHELISRILLEQGKHEQALEHIEKAYRLEPKNLETAMSLGHTQVMSQKYSQAKSHYQQLLKQTNHPRVHFGYALLLLLQGEYEEGFKHYEHRPKQKPHFVDLPWWSGAPIKAQDKLLIYTEQGIGDIIFFSAWLSSIQQQCKSVTLLCDGKLEALLSQSFPKVTVIAKQHQSKIEKVAKQHKFIVGIGSLPRICQISGAKQIKPSQFITADKKLTQKLSQKYGKSKNKVIGISWCGGMQKTMNYARVTQLEQWLPILKAQGNEFVSLQHGVSKQEIEAFNQKHATSIIFDESITTIEDLAAQIASCDQVITIDNSNAHLAGALGVPTTVLLNEVPVWQWGLNTDKSFCYKSVTLLRKTTTWQDLIKNIQKLL